MVASDLFVFGGQWTRFFRFAVYSVILLLTVLSNSAAAVGTVSGSFEATPSGAASYRIPITMPPGTAGMAPKLALVYNSQFPRGSLGSGWSLSGLRRLSRCFATLAQDGFVDGIDLDDNDRLCLDGERLVAVSGSYGRDGTEYRTEVESFQRVVGHGDINAPGAYFEVQTKAGLTLMFGAADGAAMTVPGGSRVLHWAVDRISDTAGNYIAVEYVQGAPDGEHQVSRIHYTGNDSAGLQPYNRVEFVYEPRPDPSAHYAHGGLIRSGQRLQAVETYADGALVRRYELTYETGDTGRSRLASIRECAFVSGNADCVPPTVFEWSESPATWTQSEVFALPEATTRSASNHRRTGQFADINGDGLTDWVKSYAGNRATYINARDGWSIDPAYELPSNIYDREGRKRGDFVDINGDGLVDWLSNVKIGGHQAVYLNTGAGWFEAPEYALPGHLYHQDEGFRTRYFSDLNGDGLPDIIYSRATEGNTVHLNSSSACQDRGCRWVRSYEYALPSRLIEDKGDSRAVLSDINNDGLPDLVVALGHHSLSVGMTIHCESNPFTQESQYEKQVHWQDIALTTYLNTGNGWVKDDLRASPYPLFNNYNHSGSPLGQLKDLNLDGLPDLIVSALPACMGSDDYRYEAVESVYLNTDGGWIEDVSYRLPSILYDGKYPRGTLTDVDGDGAPDLVVATARNNHLAPTEVRTYLLRPHKQCDAPSCKWVEAPDRALPEKPFANRIKGEFVDLNGDGLEDLVMADAAVPRATYLSEPKTPDLLVRVENAFGAEIKIDYGLLTDSEVYSVEREQAYPAQPLLGPQRVVKTHFATGPQGLNEVRHRYGGAYSDLSGRGFLGFGERSVLEVVTERETTTRYAQSFPFVGLAEKSEVTVQGAVTHTIEKSLDAVVLGAGASERYFPYESQRVAKSYDPLSPGQGAIKVEELQTQYDDWGNAVRMTEAIYPGANPGARHLTVMQNTYQNDESRWHLGRLVRTEATRTAPGGDTGTRVSTFAYHPQTGLLTEEIVEPGTPLELHRSYTHDAFGNRMAETLAGPDVDPRETHWTYDARGQFAVQVTNALGHTETREFSARHGGLKRQTGPNGLTTVWTYDAFGRGLREDRADGTWSETTRSFCDTQCPDGGVFRVAQAASDGSGAFEVYDQLEQPVLAGQLGFDGRWILTAKAYDAVGQVARESAPYFEGDPPFWTRFTYDLMGRVTRIEAPANEDNPAGRVERFEYAGLVTRKTDSLGAVTERENDVLGQPVRVVDALGHSTVYEYDSFGNQVAVVGPDGVRTTMAYDRRGNKVAMSDPNMGSWSYAYNAFGELIGQTDANGQTLAVRYDGLGRMVLRIEPEGISRWQYDAGWIGKLDEVTGPGGYGQTLAYDGFGRIKKKTITPDVLSFDFRYEYDDQSRLETLTYPSGFAIRNVYNARGFLVQVQDAASADVIWFARGVDVFGNVTIEDLGNGLSTVRVYDRATGAQRLVASGRGVLSDIQNGEYQWDKAGNLIA